MSGRLEQNSEEIVAAKFFIIRKRPFVDIEKSAREGSVAGHELESHIYIYKVSQLTVYIRVKPRHDAQRSASRGQRAAGNEIQIRV